MDINKIKYMTQEPGIYIMKNKSGTVIYVGKAKNLKKRLTSYFDKRPKTKKTHSLVKDIATVETIITNSEVEALVLELNLIRKHQPRYNIKLKTGNAYPYIVIDKNLDFPFFRISFNNTKSNYTYFGPYPQKYIAYDLVKTLNESFKLRVCSEHELTTRSRPCMLFQIGKCSAPCVKKVTKEEYKEQYENAIKSLQGTVSAKDYEELEKKMEEAAEREEYERAGRIRDQIKQIKLVSQKQSVITSNNQENKYYMNISREGEFYYIGVAFYEKGKMVDLSTFIFEDYDYTAPSTQYLEDFIANYFLDKEDSQLFVPEKVNPELAKALNIKINVIEEQEQTIMTMILKNLNRSDEPLGIEELEKVKEELGLSKIPHKIECLDISHLQGTNVVAAKTCFFDGLPAKDFYRKYRMHNQRNDDFNNMKEIIGRRFSDYTDAFPDLLIIDGGLGQLNAVKEKLEQMNIQGIEVVGLAKDKVKNEFTDQEVTSSGERIIKDSNTEILLKPGTVSYRIATQIRNEAHRFAIKYHRELRKKNFIP